ncbi:MAG: Uma2 family endonuclease [Egibacteraceae bacterium]
MSDPLVIAPPGGWTTTDLDELPVSNYRYELTDGALTVTPSPSSLHQVLALRLGSALVDLAPEPYAVTGAVEIRFTRQLTRIPDLLVFRAEDPTRHWFSPAEVIVAVEIESPGSHIEDRVTKPALYAQFGIPQYWRIELSPLRVVTYRLSQGATYSMGTPQERLKADAPFPIDLALAELLPRWAR